MLVGNMKESVAQKLIEGTRDGYDTIAAHFSQTRQAPWPEVQNLIDLYLHPTDKILDVGCGNGRVADLTDKIKADYTGLDLSGELIAIARKLHPQQQFVVGNMMHTDFADNTFDAIMMIASFCHIPSKAHRIQTLQEMSRITKPGGILMMTNWNKYQWRFAGLRARSLLNLLRGRNQLDYGDMLVPWKNQQRGVITQRYYHFFTAREMIRLARAANLTLIDQYYETQGTHRGKHGAANMVTVLQKPELTA